MSIVPLQRVTFVGMSSEKERLLDDLQRKGCLELIPLGNSSATSPEENPSTDAREALKFLLSSPQRRKQVTDDSRFDATEIERKATEIRKRIYQLEAERDDLQLRCEAARPFGQFRFPPLEQLQDLRLWFYVVPLKELPKVEASGLTWEVVRRDERFCYVVVVDKTEPKSMPVPRSRIGTRSPADLDRQLEDVELALEDAQAERAYLTRWCLLLARDIAELENSAARSCASHQTLDRSPLFALEAWAPQDQVGALAEYAEQNNFVFHSRPARSEENPPTLMHNAPRMTAGEDLVNFYMTPGYTTWDPSGIVFVSFAIFFAMIMADAGYAAVLGVGLLVGWRWLGRSKTGERFRPMLTLLVVASVFYGVVVGSYFGLTPGQGSLLGRFHWIDMSNSRLMMGLSVLVGGLHVVLANVMDARRHADWRDGLASVGWACAVGGGLVFGAGVAIPSVAMFKVLGGGAIVLGLLLVLGYTAPHEKPLQRSIQGLLGLTKISSAFGDVLSYLRLFALGLASASLAAAFNDMAAGIHRSVPRVGLVMAALILLFGHSLNLLLGVSSGVIHGLRLNVIEFFNWGLKDEGRRFNPFRQKEGSL